MSKVSDGPCIKTAYATKHSPNHSSAAQATTTIFLFLYFVFSSPRSPFIAINVGSAAWGVRMLSVIAMNVACVFLSACSILISASRTSTRIIVLCAEKICSRRANPLKIYPVATPFMLIVSASWLALITDVPFAKRRSSRNNPWQQLGRRVLGTLQSTRCLEIYSE